MQIHLCDINKKLCEAWQLYFNDCQDMLVHCNSFTNIAYDTIVGPGNSFGHLDGGFDFLIKKTHPEAQIRLYETLKENYCGELNVGQACYVRLDHNKHLIYAPTMRVPMNIEGTDNVYRAMLAILQKAMAVNKCVKYPLINDILIPGLGTGVGGLHPKEAALQMFMAYMRYKDPKIVSREQGRCTQNLLDRQYKPDFPTISLPKNQFPLD